MLALAREGYTWRQLSVPDLRAGGWLTAGSGVCAAPTGAPVPRRWPGSLSRRAFVAAAQRYVPELTVDDVVRGPAGVRAQAMDSDGTLVDDFRIERHGRVTALRNAPSPAATSSLAIAEHLVAEVMGHRRGTS